MQRAYSSSYMIVILEIFSHPEFNYEIYNSFNTSIIIKKTLQRKRKIKILYKTYIFYWNFL